MESTELLSYINKIFIDIFNNKSIVLNDTTTVDDIAEWNSLNHIQIITAIESRFNITFELNELLNFNDIGDLCRCVQAKLN